MNNRNPHIHTLSVVTILFCFLFADILNAQDRPYHDHRDHRDRQSQRDMDDQRDEPVLGLRVGANYANVWDESDQEFEADGVFGPAGGVFLSMPLGPYIGLQPEILFSQKGYTRDGEFLGEEYNFSRRASYIDIPFQLQLKPSPYVSVVAGPQYSILIDDRWDYEFADTVEGDFGEELAAGDIRDHVVGLVGGLDFNFSRTVLSARAGWDLMSNEGDGDFDEPRYKNAWLQLTLGVRF